MSCHYRTTPLFPGAVILGDFIQMKRHAMGSQGGRGVGLVTALLLSVGLWGAMWLAASALAAVWPW
jgi:3-hydroxymyristoyl/3-hydroxydecanoyl-(acyl carrier protein) dehydratase